MTTHLANGLIQSLFINTLVGHPGYKQYINSKDGIKIKKTIAFHGATRRYRYKHWPDGEAEVVFSCPYLMRLSSGSWGCLQRALAWGFVMRMCHELKRLAVGAPLGPFPSLGPRSSRPQSTPNSQRTLDHEPCTDDVLVFESDLPVHRLVQFRIYCRAASFTALTLVVSIPAL